LSFTEHPFDETASFEEEGSLNTGISWMHSLLWRFIMQKRGRVQTFAV